MRNFLDIPVKRMIPLLGAAIVAGALIQRNFYTTGLVVSLSAISVLIIFKTKNVFYTLKNFKKVSRINKIRFLTFIGLGYILVAGIAKGGISYFTILLIFGIEYLIGERPTSE